MFRKLRTILAQRRRCAIDTREAWVVWTIKVDLSHPECSGHDVFELPKGCLQFMKGFIADRAAIHHGVEIYSQVLDLRSNFCVLQELVFRFDYCVEDLYGDPFFSIW